MDGGTGKNGPITIDWLPVAELMSTPDSCLGKGQSSSVYFGLSNYLAS